jgi:hypothetical protein
MTILSIEQAVYSSQGRGGYQFRARSPGFTDDWLAEAERLCTGFGERPANVACPAAIFAQPFGMDQVAVVQVADQGTDDAGRPGALAFHLLILPRTAYHALLGDPFLIAERFPPPWHARDTLPTLSWPAEPLPTRSVAEVQELLKRPDSATLLGGTQALIDGSRLVFERPAPDPDLLRGLWKLLPASTRCQLWPASFAFGNALIFHVLAVPRIPGEEWDTTYADYLREEQAGDYPQGRYELNVQIAAETGDQRELDALFFRRSSSQTLRLALYLIGVAAVLALVMKLLTVPQPPLASPRSTAAAILKLPPSSAYAPLTDLERQRLEQALRRLADHLGIGPEPTTAEALLAAIDAKLGTPERWPFGPLSKHGPPQRQLRVLLLKHHVEGYADVRLNEAELVERLEQKVGKGHRD